MKKNLTVLAVVIVLVIMGCNNIPKSVENVGGDKDKHGCKASTGYTWSELKNNCVRIFETGTQFSAYGKNLDSTLAAYVIISGDQKKAEVFVPSNYSKESIILDAVKNSKDNIKTTLFENKQKMISIDLSKDKYLIIIKNDPVFYQNRSEIEGLGKLIKE
jgi:hypothetical protein